MVEMWQRGEERKDSALRMSHHIIWRAQMRVRL